MKAQKVCAVFRRANASFTSLLSKAASRHLCDYEVEGFDLSAQVLALIHWCGEFQLENKLGS